MFMMRNESPCWKRQSWESMKQNCIFNCLMIAFNMESIYQTPTQLCYLSVPIKSEMKLLIQRVKRMKWSYANWTIIPRLLHGSIDYCIFIKNDRKSPYLYQKVWWMEIVVRFYRFSDCMEINSRFLLPYPHLPSHSVICLFSFNAYRVYVVVAFC